MARQAFVATRRRGVLDSFGAVAVFSVLAFAVSVVESFVVHSVVPVSMGLAGGIPITVFGVGFDVGDSDSTLRATFDGRPCAIDPFVSTDSMFVCVPTPIPAPTQVDRDAELTLVDRDNVPETFRIQLLVAVTPWVTRFQHAALWRGDLRFSSTFGSRRVSDFTVRFTPGSSSCSLVAFYAAQGSSSPGASDRFCRLQATPPGFYKAALVAWRGESSATATGPSLLRGVSLPLRSHAQEVEVPHDDGVTGFTTQVFGEVTAVSPASISPAGGVFLTISGFGFSSVLTDNIVTLGENTTCVPTDVTASALVCLTSPGLPAQPKSANVGVERRVFVTSGVTGHVLSRLTLTNLFTYTENQPLEALAEVTDFEDRSSGTRRSGTHFVALRSVFTPRVSGVYRFFCSASEYVQFDISVTSAEPVMACHTFNSSADPLLRFNSPPATRPTSVAYQLEAGRSYPILVHYAVFDATSFMSVGMTVTPATPQPTAVGGVRSRFLLPQIVLITAPPADSNATGMRTSTFSIRINGSEFRIPAIRATASCSSVSLSNKFREESNAVIQSTEAAVPSDSPRCAWVIRFADPVDITTSDPQLMTDLVPGGGGRGTWYPSIPARLLMMPLPSTARPATSLPIRVRVRGQPVFYASHSSPLSVVFVEPSPIVTSVTPFAVFTGTRMTVVGQNLDSTATPTVFFGTSANRCTGEDTFIGGTSFNCVVPPMSGGVYPVTISFGERGWDRSFGSVTVRNDFTVSALPVTVSAHGGATLVVLGEWLPNAESLTASQSGTGSPLRIEARIGAALCNISFINATRLFCVAPPLVAALNGTAPQDAPIGRPNNFSTTFALRVSIVSGNVTLTPRDLPQGTINVTYRDASLSPAVESVIPNQGFATVDRTLIVVGRNLRGAEIRLCRGGFLSGACVSCALVAATASTTSGGGGRVSPATPAAASNNDTHTTCSLMALPPASYSVIAVTPGFGRSSSNVTFVSVFTIAEVIPAVGSALGGSRLTIAGFGFGSDSVVAVGPRNCEVLSRVGEMRIVCVIRGALPKAGVEYDVVVTSRRGALEATCAGANGVCTFMAAAHSVDATVPHVAAVVPREGQASMITVLGVNFPADSTLVLVTIGSQRCAMRSYVAQLNEAGIATGYKYVCQPLQPEQAGVVRMTVLVDPFGFVEALRAELFTYTFELAVVSVTPTIGSAAGGQLVTLTGVGFGPNSTVTMVGTPCTVGPLFRGSGVNGSTIICETGARTSLASADGPVVVDNRNGFAKSCCVYRYDKATTWVLSSVQPLVVTAGASFTIKGSTSTAGCRNLCLSSVVDMTIAGVSVASINRTGGTETFGTEGPQQELMGQLAFVAAFRAPVTVLFPNGFGWSHRPLKLTHSPALISVSPQEVSEAGGALVTITGTGFGLAAAPSVNGSVPASTLSAADNLRVLVCDNECLISWASYDRIICEAPAKVSQDVLDRRTSLHSRLRAAIRLRPYTSIATATNLDYLTDGLLSTVYRAPDTYVTVQTSNRVAAFLHEVHVFPEPGFEHLLLGALVQINVQESGSQVGWTTVAAIGRVVPGWNTIVIGTSQHMRLVRLAGLAPGLRIAEVAAVGVVAASLSTPDCPVVVAMQPPGSEPVSTSTNSVVLSMTQFATPLVETVSPRFGSPFGGTVLTLTGQNFIRTATVGAQTVLLDNVSSVVITVDGRLCPILPLDATSEPASQATVLKCTLPPQPPSSNPLFGTGIRFFRAPSGFGLVDADFMYAGPWSAATTWQGEDPPSTDSVVIIPKGFTVILDVPTPRLGALLIEGQLVTSDDARPGFVLSITALYIVIDGGALIVGKPGAPATPFAGTLRISLVGARLAPELPLYGRNVLAVANGGQLLLYGRTRSIRPFFRLLSVEAGSRFLTIVGSPSWAVGDTIVVSSSSADPNEAEARVITSVTQDKGNSAYGFAEPLRFHHAVGERETTVRLAAVAETSAEVVSLSRTIIIEGEPDTLVTGEGGGHIVVTSAVTPSAATQSTAGGAHARMTSLNKATRLVGGSGVTQIAASGTTRVHLSGVEIRNMGQRAKTDDETGASGVGRYPLYFAAVGLALDSYVRDCAIHSSVNRGIVVEQTDYLEIKGNVVYNTRGHGIATLRGSSRWLRVLDNIVISSLPSDAASDEQVANFYFTHPSITVQNNVAGGAGHAGIWFHLLPTSLDSPSLCPDQAAFVLVRDNAVHSSQIGVLVAPRHYPRAIECGGFLTVQNPPSRREGGGIISGTRAFRNSRFGLYSPSVGAYTITGSWFVDNGAAGVAFTDLQDSGAVISFSVFVGRSQNSAFAASRFRAFSASQGVTGIAGPGSEGLSIVNVTFRDYRGDVADATGGIVAHRAVTLCYFCGFEETREVGGFTFSTSWASFENATHRLWLAPPGNDMVVDLDGSFLGMPLLAASASTPLPSNATQKPVVPNRYTAMPRYAHLSRLPGCNSLPVETPPVVIGGGSEPHFVCNGSYSFHRLIVHNVRPLLPPSVKLLSSSAYGRGSQAWSSVSSTSKPWLSGFVTFVASGSLLGTDGALHDVSWINATYRTSSETDLTAFSVSVSFPQAPRSAAVVASFPYAATYVTINAFGQKTQPASATSFQRTPRNAVSFLPPDALPEVIPTVFGAPSEATVDAAATIQESAMYVDTPASTFHIVLADQSVATLANVNEMQTFDVMPLRCAATGCLLVKPAVVPPVSRSWLDPRAWPNRLIPQDGDNVTIPPGLTVELSGNSSRLRALIVQGTLVFHPRLATVLFASFVVIHGGTLKFEPADTAGKMAIVLLNDPKYGRLGISETIIVHPGTFIAFGALNVKGHPKRAPWSALSTTVVTGSAVKTASTITWARGDTVVLSSASYVGLNIDEVIVEDVEPDQRGFKTNTPMKHEHAANSVDVPGATTKLAFTLAAHAAVITRNFIIQPENETHHGCSVIFSELGMDKNFAASGLMQGVEVRGCGRPNDVVDGSVRFDYVRRKELTFSQGSVHHSHGIGVLFVGSAGVKMEFNVVYNTTGAGIDMGDSAGNTLSDNIVLGQQFPAWMRAPAMYTTTPYALCSYDSRFAVNTMTRNVAAGSESEGFCVALPPCPPTTTDEGDTGVDSAGAAAKPAMTHSDNEAHSNVIGFFVAHAPPPSIATGGTTQTCGIMKGNKAWKNSYIGIHSAPNMDVVLSGIVSHNNHIALSLGREGSGTINVTGAALGGRSPAFDGITSCAQFECIWTHLGTDSKCRGRAEILGDESRSFIRGEIGVLMASFLAKTKTADYIRSNTLLPVTRPLPSVAPAESGSVFFNATTFAHFLFGREYGKCSGSTMIATNGFQVHPVAVHRFRATSLPGMIPSAADGKVFLHTPSSTWRTRNMCNGNLCDALNHVAIVDQDGTFMERSKDSPAQAGSIVAPYSEHALNGCGFNKGTQSYECPGVVYADVKMTNLDADAQTRPIEPLLLQDQEYLARINVNFQPPDCTEVECHAAPTFTRPPSITTVVQVSRVYLVDFGAQSPRRSRWTLRNCEAGAAVVLRVTLDALLRIQVWVDAAIVPPTTTRITVEDAVAGSNYFDPTDSRLYMLLQCNRPVEVHQLVSAVLSLRIALSIEDFVPKAHTLLPNMAVFLGIPLSRLGLREVYPGSTVVAFEIIARDSANYSATQEAQDVNALVMRIVSSSAKTLSDAIGMPVIDVDDIRWAEGSAQPLDPTAVSVELSTGLIVSITVGSVLIVLIVAFSCWRAYKRVLQFREVEAELPEDREVIVPELQVANSVFVAPTEDEVSSKPHAEIRVKSLKIRVDEDEDEPATVHRSLLRDDSVDRPGTGASSAAAANNVFGDDEDDDEEPEF